METYFEKKRARILNGFCGDCREEMAREIRRGLTGPGKRIPCKYLYDARGSILFERICCTPEYYLTSLELFILSRRAAEIMDFFSRSGGDLVELGSGACTKIRKLLDAVDRAAVSRIRYVPVDISESALHRSVAELSSIYKQLRILGIVADLTGTIDLLDGKRKLILFLGSTFGNFTHEEESSFLQVLRQVMGPGDRLLIGLDMIKPVRIIEAAYNDQEGITEAFNRNILRHLNEKLNADFEPSNFRHVAFFNKDKESIEMHLRSLREQRVYVEDLKLEIHLEEGETIHTESCRKFSREDVVRSFREGGFRTNRWFTDPKGWFSLAEFRIA